MFLNIFEFQLKYFEYYFCNIFKNTIKFKEMFMQHC